MTYTRNSFYAIPKERLANIIHYPSTVEVNGDLLIRYRSGTRKGEILLSDYVMPEIQGTRTGQVRPYVALGTRAEITARSQADLNVIRAYLDRAVKRLEI